MILADTGPLVAIYNPADPDHAACLSAAERLNARLVTTTSVLTEVFYFLGPASRGSNGLRTFVADGDIDIWHFDDRTLLRAFELMQIYADHPMDLADASLVTAAESLGLRTVFTLDNRDFATYRVCHGHRHYPFEILPLGRS
jgi:uncharacterized protein